MNVGYTLGPPTRRTLAEVRPEARRVLSGAQPPATYREAADVYRSLMRGWTVFFRCWADEHSDRLSVYGGIRGSYALADADRN